MNRREFLRLTALAGVESLSLDAAPEPFSWTASGATFSFVFYKSQLRQMFLLPSEAGPEVRKQLEPSSGGMNPLADVASGNFDPMTLEVALHCTGEDVPEHHGMKFSAAQPGLRLVFAGAEKQRMATGEQLVLTHRDPVLKLKVRSIYEAHGTAPVVRRYTEIRNEGSQAVGIEYLSSAMLANFARIESFGQDLRIHLCENSWQAEGQWRAWRPAELGLVPNGEFSLSAVFESSIGSWSSERFLPMCIIENTALDLAWFWQIEYCGSWHAEISQTSARTLYAYVGGPDEQYAHAWKNLAAGQTYRSVPVAVGCVRGGFGKAVEALTKYRRILCEPFQARNRACSVIFNDALAFDLDPTAEKELSIVEAVATAGCEYFVIDAGWYGEAGQNWWGAAGDWDVPKSRWPNGLKPVMDAIRAHGMKPGLWLEPEVAGIDSRLARKPDDWFFMRHGKRVIDHGRYLLDFRNPDVRRYLDAVVDGLIRDYGIEYIKLDYNVDALEGTDLHADSAGQGLYQHTLSLLTWLDRVLGRYPQLVIENCASGGGRIDYALLARLQLESASDQDDYRRYPSLVTGLSAGLLPEQLGVWTFPATAATQVEASFHMVNAMLGRIQLSGNLKQNDAIVNAHIREGIRIYKSSIRGHIPLSVPFYPLGMPRMDDKASPAALGLRAPEASFLAIWRREGSEKVSMPISGNKWRLLYPQELGIEVEQSNGRLAVRFPLQNMACILAA